MDCPDHRSCLAWRAAALTVTAEDARRQNPPTAQEARFAALTFVRLVNTAEIYYRVRHGHYAAYADLLESPEFAKAAGMQPFRTLPAGEIRERPQGEPLLGFSATLVVSADGGSYKLFVQEEDVACGYSLFTDERGVIYHGKPIDCPVE